VIGGVTRGGLARRGATSRFALVAALTCASLAAFATFAMGCVDGKTPDCSAEAGLICGPDFDGNFPDAPSTDGGDGGGGDAPDGGGPIDAPADVRDAPVGDAPLDSPRNG
jgi:hypothetical protein